jgi:hypothetical protein
MHWCTKEKLEREQRKQEHIEKLKTIKSIQLLEETLDMAGGDDYDGCFTDEGLEVYELYKEELKKRVFLVEDNC